jgi:hypothetical protein
MSSFVAVPSGPHEISSIFSHVFFEKLGWIKARGLDLIPGYQDRR